MPLSNSDKLNKKLYEKSLKFHLSQPTFADSRDPVQMTLSIEWQNVNNSSHNKELLIVLTDPVGDPFFIYNLTLNSSDFDDLKHEQGLLVDFLAFPQSLINLLSLCAQDENKKNPRYLLHLTLDTGTYDYALLNVKELNEFKVLTHLSLKLSSPSEAVVKQYLTNLYKSQKKDNGNLKSRITCLEQERDKLFQRLNEAKSNYDETIHTLQTKGEGDNVEIRRQYEEKLRTEKENATRVLNTECRKLKERCSEMETNCQNRLKTSDVKIKQLEDTLKRRQERITALERIVSENEVSLENCKKEVTITNKELANCIKQNDNLQSKIDDLENYVESLKSATTDLRNQILGKEDEIAETQTRLDKSLKDKQSADNHIMSLNAKINKSQEVKSVLKRDISKANEIIKKFQNQAHLMDSEIQRQRHTIKVQQVELQDSEKAERTMEDNLRSADATIKMQKKELEILYTQVSKLKTQYTELEIKIQNKKKDSEDLCQSSGQIVAMPSASTSKKNTVQRHSLIYSETQEIDSQFPSQNIVSYQKANTTTNVGNHMKTRESTSLDPKYLEIYPVPNQLRNEEVFLPGIFRNNHSPKTVPRNLNWCQSGSPP